MKTTIESQQIERAKAAGNRAVGPQGEKLPKKQQKLLNLKEESHHQSGQEKLATEKATREVDQSED